MASSQKGIVALFQIKSCPCVFMLCCVVIHKFITVLYSVLFAVPLKMLTLVVATTNCLSYTFRRFLFTSPSSRHISIVCASSNGQHAHACLCMCGGLERRLHMCAGRYAVVQQHEHHLPCRTHNRSQTVKFIKAKIFHFGRSLKLLRMRTTNIISDCLFFNSIFVSVVIVQRLFSFHFVSVALSIARIVIIVVVVRYSVFTINATHHYYTSNNNNWNRPWVEELTFESFKLWRWWVNKNPRRKRHREREKERRQQHTTEHISF